jgi:exodeoxyribonuclease VII small subunit
MPLSPNPETFEAAYRELQQVVAQLENGDPDLERLVQLFERGSQLVQMCERIVDAAELRVTRLAAESPSPLPDVPVDH